VSVDRRDVERIATLARLRFDDEEIDRLTSEIKEILDHVEVLSGLADIRPPTPAATAADPAPSRPSEPDTLKVDLEVIAPNFSDGFFVVPPPAGEHDDGCL